MGIFGRSLIYALKQDLMLDLEFPSSSFVIQFAPGNPLSIS